ncbi:phenylacetaldehyde oxime monooxygenase CYP71AN24 [Arachis hypogaea]|uniref:phenylacetaldehyde oxime monooxygenase CYP71AN24 n=1 Tax=Arachis hypogaea TaxID=3818 RepID=UPI003B20BDE6
MEVALSIVEKLQHQPNSTLSTICFIIITILCVLINKFTRRNNKFNKLPPSPPKLPIIGNLHQLGTLPHQSLKALSDKYGPILLLQLGQTKALVVSSADIVEEIVKTHDVAFSNRANTKAAKGKNFDKQKEWAFAELANNPKIMKKVQEEVRRIVGGKSKIEENDLNQMKYMKCVIKETLRLHPPGPFLIPRETLNSVEIKGYHIPKKVTVYINLYAIHRDPKLWDNAEEFIPERFEGAQQVDYKVKDFQLIPFGFGRRRCPGISFGVASVEYMMANLLCWFDWKVPNNNNSAMIDMSEMSGLNVTKKQPLYLKPTPYLIC